MIPVVTLLFLLLGGGPDYTISLRSAGPVRFGATVDQAARSAGTTLRRVDSGNDSQWECGYVQPENKGGLSFMTSQGRIVRADVSYPTIRTLSGRGVGSSEAEIHATYGDRIRVEPHPYGDADDHYLIYVPRDREDQDYGLIFETEDGYVVQYRAGLKPYVDYIEGCL